MWIGDTVDILEPKTIKRKKTKMKVINTGKIIEHVTQIGLSYETSVFLVDTVNGQKIEVSEDFLTLKEKKNET